ncbi:MAG: OmpA family protein [Bacteroidales bacterium]|nr:OmpA family protein [Bacteroidales bacterium]
MNYKKTGLAIAIICIFSFVAAQEDVKIKKREFRRTDQSKGFKEAWKSLKNGDDYYDDGVGTYNLALDHYLFADQYNGFNAELNYKIGICYIYGDNKYRSLDYFLKAFELKPDITSDIRFLIARAYHYNLKFDEAKNYYLQHKATLEPDEEMVRKSAEIEKHIIECTHGKELTAMPVRVMLKNLGDAVNSKYDDYNPRFAYNDSALYFTSRRPFGKRSRRHKLDNKYYEDIYISSIQDGEFKEARLLGKPFKSKGNESIVGVAPDGSSVFVYIGKVNGGDIQQAFFREDKDKWKKPKSLSRFIGSDSEETTAVMSPDGRELFFVSSNSELTSGGKDIFVTKMNAKGKWDDPKNLGGLINSKYDEEGVYLTNDGRTLYFSSKGHNSMGGFDVFRSDLDENGFWSPPKNLGYPINTPEDEIFYVTDSSGVYGYYATIREEGLGGKDIYKVVKLGTEKELISLFSNDLVAGSKLSKFDPFLTDPKRLEVDSSLLVEGVIRDTSGIIDTVVMAGISFIDPSSGMEMAKTMSGQDGKYKVSLPEPKAYGVEVNASGYLYFLDMIDLSMVNTDETVEADFYLQKIEVGVKVVLKNIYFETGKSILSPESFEALNQVVRFLESNTSVRLEISGHTDNIGSKQVNKRLSEQRAKAVVDYIAGKGIARSRLEYAGYADEQPVATNDTSEGREMNRRVEFQILSK